MAGLPADVPGFPAFLLPPPSPERENERWQTNVFYLRLFTELECGEHEALGLTQKAEIACPRELGWGQVLLKTNSA